MRLSMLAGLILLLPALCIAQVPGKTYHSEAELQADLARQRAAQEESDRYWTQRDSQAAAANAAQMDKIQRDALAAQAEGERQDGIRRKTCGADYGRPAVGMSIARARSCVGDLVRVGQINRADGVVTLYRAGALQLAEMDGRVVAWHRY